MSAAGFACITDVYRGTGPPYDTFVQEHRSGGALPARLMRVAQDPFEATDPAMSNVVIALVVGGEDRARWDIGDGWTDFLTFRVGDLTVVPSGVEIPQVHLGKHEIIAMSLPADHVSKLFDDHGVRSKSPFEVLVPTIPFRDTETRRALMSIWQESRKSDGASDLLIDGLTQVLIARLLDKAGALARPVLIPTLSQTEVGRLDELIDDHLAERITVETLARALDMPRWTFSDAFKATTGETPHAYVTARRIARACDLLRLGNMPLAEIAYAVGFASQPHMTDTFRRHLGTTPGAWRKEIRR